jgi:hypothetical protein
MHGDQQAEQESSSGGNGNGNGKGNKLRRQGNSDGGFSGYDIELKQHGSPTWQFDINSSSSWGQAERSLLVMVERNKANKVFD